MPHPAYVKTPGLWTSAPARPANAWPQRAPAVRVSEASSELGSGTPLPSPERVQLERRLGHDFSHVRVHSDARGAALASAVGAKAFASGNDLVFAAGRYQPGATDGRELLAHELSHVAQQRQGGGPAAAAETRARAAAQTITQGESVAPAALGGAEPGIHCDPEDESKKTPYGPPRPSLLPAVPNFQLSTLPPLDYFKFQGIAGAHGMRFTDRDASDLGAEWKRSAAMLRLFGLDRGLHLGPLSWTGDELLNIALGKQFQDRLARENPNSWDRLNQQWDLSHPGGFTIPPSLLSKTWTF